MFEIYFEGNFIVTKALNEFLIFLKGYLKCLSILSDLVQVLFDYFFGFLSNPSSPLPGFTYLVDRLASSVAQGSLCNTFSALEALSKTSMISVLHCVSLVSPE